MPVSEVTARPASRNYNARNERSPQHSFPPHSLPGQQDSKRFSVLSTTSSPRSSPPTSPFPQQQHPRILFYHSHDPYYGFTNFSNHPVVYNGKKYPTSEHLFQSFKFQEHRPDLAEHIRTCSERPSVAFSEARRFQPEVRRDWKEVNIAMMDIVVQLKFEQHDDLRAELLGTGNASLFEDSDKDAFWGVGADWTGRNELGKALERLRTKLCAASRTSLIQTHTPQLPVTVIPTLPPTPKAQLRPFNTQATQTPSPTHSHFLNHAQPPTPAHSPTQTRFSTHIAQASEPNAQSQSHDPSSIKSSSDIQLNALVVARREMCRLPECIQPVYYDGKVRSEYCSQQHRQ
ncbi:hypothetical protein H0H87_001023 [Tephrocybe sp. NHM501043]|nr:hypothetical protein H0H87_001023 [Tephrocybe sp. NHM501043]